MALTPDDIQALKEALKPEFDSLRQEINTRLDAVDEAIKNVSLELIRYTGELHKDHEDRITKLERRSSH